jgi:hypothetical protein
MFSVAIADRGQPAIFIHTLLESIMRFLALALSIIAVSFALTGNPARAQITRVWVSSNGDDNNNCASTTTPCRSFGSAISKIGPDGEIDCLDAGGFGFLTITKSVTIDCHEQFASIQNNVDNTGIVIDFSSFNPNDAHKTVNLRNLIIQGNNDGGTGIQIQGSGASGNGAGSYVNIEDCLINGSYVSGHGIGINDLRDRGTLTVNNTTVRNAVTEGIFVTAAASGSKRAVISNSRVINSNAGIIAGQNVEMVIVNSIVSNNFTVGLFANQASQMIVRGSTVAHNTLGMQTNGGSLILDGSAVLFNSTGFTGTVLSHSNNTFDGNGALGTITPIGSTTNPSGLR